MNELELWSAVLEKMNEKLNKTSFDTWLQPTKVRDFVDDSLVVETTNEFQRDWLEIRYREQIEKTIKELTNEAISVTFVAENTVVGESINKENIGQQKNGKYDELLEMILKLNRKVEKLEGEIEALKGKHSSYQW